MRPSWFGSQSKWVRAKFHTLLFCHREIQFFDDPYMVRWKTSDGNQIEKSWIANVSKLITQVITPQSCFVIEIKFGGLIHILIFLKVAMVNNFNKWYMFSNSSNASCNFIPCLISGNHLNKMRAQLKITRNNVIRSQTSVLLILISVKEKRKFLSNITCWDHIPLAKRYNSFAGGHLEPR